MALWARSATPATLESGVASDTSKANEATALVDNSKHTSWLGGISLTTLGSALVCCLADGDAGSLFIAAQSGARWEYSLTLVQLILVPVLFSILEALTRTAASEKRGFGAMIRNHFGYNCAVFCLALLLVSCFGAMVSQMSGISQVAILWGIPQDYAAVLTATFIIFVVIICNYRQVETVALVFGFFELIFVGCLFRVHPPASEVFTGMFRFSFGSATYLRMLAANIGAVVMPWMVYFQQGAVVARKVSTGKEVAEERTQSLLGSAVAQLIMVSTMMVLAATPQEAKDISGIFGIQAAMEPVFGALTSKVLISMAFLGGSVCAIFVVSLAAAWATCDSLGDESEAPFSLDAKLSEAPRFYMSFIGIVILGACAVLTMPDVVKLNVYIEVLNAFTVPISLFVLYIVVTGPSMSSSLRIDGAHQYVLLCLFAFTAAVAVGSTLMSALPAV